jgi:ribosomal protein L29
MKYKEIEKLSKQERENKLKELKMELVKSKTGAQKQGSSKTKKIRKIIARIHTFNNKKTLLEKHK